MFSALLLTALTSILILNVILLNRTRSSESSERRLRDDIERLRQNQSDQSRALREEIAAGIQRFAGQNDQRAESLRTAVTQHLTAMQQTVDEKLQSTSSESVLVNPSGW